MDFILLRSDSECEGDTQVAVGISRTLLCKESPVFRAMFTWKRRHDELEEEETVGNKKQILSVDGNQPTCGNSEEAHTTVVECSASEKDDGKKTEPEQTKDDTAFIVDVKCYKALAVKVLFDYIQGHIGALKECKDFDVLAEAIVLCDFYGMTQFVRPIKGCIDDIEISTGNLMEAMRTVQRFENNDLLKETVQRLENRCVKFFMGSFPVTVDALQFVENNTTDTLLARLFRAVRIRVQSGQINLKDIRFYTTKSGKMMASKNGKILAQWQK